MASAAPDVPPASATAAAHLGISPALTVLSPTAAGAPLPSSATTHASSTLEKEAPSGATTSPALASDSAPTAPAQTKTTSPAAATVQPSDSQAGTAPDAGDDVDAKRPPGRQSWAQGNKHAYLESFEEDWRTATEGGLEAARRFYDRCTNGFLHKFGYDRPIEEDDPSPNPDPAPMQLTSPPPAPPGLTKEEADARSRYHHELRQVRAPYIVASIIPLTLSQKIQRWFAHRGRYLRRTQLSHDVQALWNAISKTHNKIPKRQTLLNFYMRTYWERIREEADADWEKARKKLVDETLQGKVYPSKKKIEGLKLQQKRTTAKRRLDKESDAFLADLDIAIEEDYQKQKAEHAKITKAPSTPQEFHE
ncbi:hypothetical protein EIP86_005978 [Pleurotus ostreatoroseus]|nr:hypothetical protein EIP86_005978 [Pleurotus ostreatoroseus]